MIDYRIEYFISSHLEKLISDFNADFGGQTVLAHRRNENTSRTARVDVDPEWLGGFIHGDSSGLPELRSVRIKNVESFWNVKIKSNHFYLKCKQS